jgi:hypothetical protein
MIQTATMINRSTKDTGTSLIPRLAYLGEHGRVVNLQDAGLRNTWKQILAWMILPAYWFYSAG